MEKIPSSQILTNLCLLCGHFDCYEEGLHKKYSLLQVQQLLQLSFQLEVSLEQQRRQFQVVQFFLSNNTQDNLRDTGYNSAKPSVAKTLQGLQKCSKKLSQVFKWASDNRGTKSSCYQSPIKALLALFYATESVAKKPLIYHDLTQIIRWLATLRWQKLEWSQTEVSLPFTRSRITKLIKYLKDSIKQKQQRLSQVGKKVNEKENNNTYNTLKVKVMDSKVKKQKKINIDRNLIAKYLKKSNQQMVVQKVLSQDNFFKRVNQKLHKHVRVNYINNYEVIQREIFCFIYQFMTKLQSKIVAKLKNQTENLHPTNIQEGNFQNHTQKESPQQAGNFHKKMQEKANSVNAQLPESMELVYIQGIPFPVNRRSIDFSMLEFSDDLLIKYLPALQKFKDLEEMCLRYNKLSQLGYKILSNVFPTLRSLDLRGNCLSKNTVQIICELKSLNILYLSQCKIYPASLIKVCLNLENLNILYCDEIQFLKQQLDDNKREIYNYKGLFYIMCLNLKKLLYFSIRGFFNEKFQQFISHRNLVHVPDHVPLTDQEKKQVEIITNIFKTLSKRHGLVEI